MLTFGVVAEPQMRSRHLKSHEHHWSEPSDDLIGLGVVAAAEQQQWQQRQWRQLLLLLWRR